MGTAIIKYKIMPESPETDLKQIEDKAKEIIKKLTNSDILTEIEPIAFGLKALYLTFSFDESKSTDSTEEELKKTQGVSSLETADFRRALG